MFNHPLSVHLEVTDSCNNACPHCYATNWIKMSSFDKRNKDHRVKPSLVELAKKIVNANIFDVIITGGEPLLVDIDNLYSLFTFFDSHHVGYSLNTNGRLLNKDICKILSMSSLKTVLVSLHAWDNSLHNKIVGSRKAAEETKLGIVNAVECGINVAVNQVVDNRNVELMVKSAVELERIGVNQISFTRALSPIDGEYNVNSVSPSKFIDEFLKCKEKSSIFITSLLPIPFCSDDRMGDINLKLSCSGGTTTGVVSCYGDVRFCPHDSYIWGNIFKEEFNVIWKRISEWRDNIPVPEKCGDCVFNLECRGGCRMASKMLYNNYSSLDPWARGVNGVINNKEKNILNNFDYSCLYKIRPDIKWRQEGDDILLYSNDKHIKINHDGLKFIENLPIRFIPDRIIDLFEINKGQGSDFLERLFHSGFLTRDI